MSEVIRLYHFTSAEESHFGSILESGLIRPTESNVSGTKVRAGPDVVWLTDEPDLAKHIGWASMPWEDGLTLPLKLEVRIAVDVPRAHLMRWTWFCTRYRVKPAWQARLARVGGASTWWVLPRAIPESEWVDITQFQLGEQGIDRRLHSANAPGRSPVI